MNKEINTRDEQINTSSEEINVNSKENNKVWIQGSAEQIALIKNFKRIFIDQEKNNIYDVFHKDFGVHNGYDIHGYCDYEFDEFALKANRFELTHEAKIECFNIGNDYIYFSLGKKNDKAVFESIFLWDENSKRIKGNQYPYKIEPKIQFFKNNTTNETHFNRRINIKTVTNNILIKNVLISQDSHDFIFFKQDLEEIFGGTFYSLLYNDDNFALDTYWNTVSIFSNQGTRKNKVLMRGKDHPLFIENLFPEVNSKYEFTVKEGVYPVIINIEFEDDTEQLLKYPLEKILKFDKKIKKICLTDNLSFDWIVTDIQD